MNIKPAPKQPITLEDITERKEAIRKEIDTQGRIIVLTVKDIFDPAPTDATNTLMHSFTKGLAIYDGVMTGIKIMRRIKAFFRRMK